MIDVYLEYSFILILAMSGASLLLLLPLIIIQNFVHRKYLDPIYFNTEHFNEYELMSFTSLPLSALKVLAYARAIVFPGTMKKRFPSKILSPSKNPAIYALALITIVLLIFCSAVLVNTLISATVYYSI